ncbi:FAD-dependent oxidoreductase [Micromonospora humidisoli]|uniref:NAD(P)/FAD-dependent oxidoreductase n=1 Tax=Micromonospora sp. WMMD734 TaxID=3404129 RepID=UPI0022BF5832|nr:FAD-binding oxidoreductase [Micromonospora sp. AKA109]GHJ11338.1 FAD-dependent oxidoreductase [Micromonospora sp. AKA109]
MSLTLPSSAQVVIIGGGIIGVSTAYHLAAAGVRNVVLLDMGPLGGGSTGRAAGGIRTQFSDRLNIDLAMRSMEILKSFPQRFNQEIDLQQVGYLFLLDSADTVADFERHLRLQNDLGLPNRMVSPAEAQQLSPYIVTDGLLAASYSPHDGYCTPESVVLGFATAARRHGAQLIPHCAVTGIETDGTTISAVRTEAGTIRTDTVICAAGAWSGSVGDWVGVSLPVTPLRRGVVYTEPLPGCRPGLPFTIDFGTAFYYRNEGRGLLLGYPDPDEQSGFDQSPTDRWLPALGRALHRRAPRLVDVGIAGGWAGLYEVTPDHNGLVGEAAETSRFLYAAGFSGHGFMMGPAVGEVVRDLYLDAEPFTDVTGFRAGRFASADVRPERNVV